MEQMKVRSQSRAAYDFIMEQSRQNGLSNVLAYPGYLRSETLLGQGQSISFNLLANQTADGQAIGGTERRLQQNDAFYIDRIALAVYAADLGTGTAGSAASQEQRAVAKLQHFANDNVFAANAGAVVGLFNGALTIKQNERIYCRDLDLYTMQYADTAQQGELIFTGSNTTQNAFQYERAFQQVIDPMFRLNGQSNVEANIQLPASLDFTAEANTSLYAVLYLKGWRAQNAGVARTAR